MKNLKSLVIVAVFTCSSFAVNSAKATTYYFSSVSQLYTDIFGTPTPSQAQLNSAYQSYFGTTTPTQAQINSVINEYVAPSCPSTALPIDNQAWILFIAAALVGCIVLVRKTKTLQAVHVRVK